jgi:hypothetical protein
MEKIRKIITPINIFRLLAAANVIVISFYSITKGDSMSELTKDRLNSLTQLLLMLLFLISGIEGVKDDDKTKRYVAYFNFGVAIIMVIVNIFIFLKI